MKVRGLSVADAYELTPVQHADDRGIFLEWFKGAVFAEAVGHELTLKQANHSVSGRGTAGPGASATGMCGFSSLQPGMASAAGRPRTDWTRRPVIASAAGFQSRTMPSPSIMNTPSPTDASTLAAWSRSPACW